jgi:hypothetical protein
MQKIDQAKEISDLAGKAFDATAPLQSITKDN